MSELKVFNNPDFGDIRTVEQDGEPWFVGKDIAVALGYTDTAQAVRKHVDEDDKGVVDLTTPGGVQKLTIINESGVYSLVFSSKLEAAKRFKHWVTAEVLPAIRKKGGYLTPEAADQLAAAVQERVRASIMEPLQALAARVEALENAVTDPFAVIPPTLPTPLPENRTSKPQPPGREYMRRWMRTASEKLNLMSSKFNMGNGAVLHLLYGYLETEFDVVLDDERIRIMEEFDLEECSTLKAVFYDEDFRDFLEEIIDHNLAPENRGW